MSTKEIAHITGTHEVKNTYRRLRNRKNSPLWRHCLEVHNGKVQQFSMSVTETHRNDCMMRQITEAVQINNLDPNRLMNTRVEMRMTRIPRASITST